MDQETREAFANLSAALAVMARRQTEHGEALAGIVRLLTDEQGKRQGGSAQELVAQLLAAIQGQGAAVAGYLKDIRAELAEARRDLPLEVVQAIDDNLGPSASAAARG